MILEIVLVALVLYLVSQISDMQKEVKELKSSQAATDVILRNGLSAHIDKIEDLESGLDVIRNRLRVKS